LNAVAQLRHAGQDVRLRVVGPFETVRYEQAVRQLARDLNVAPAIDWIGFADDIGAELAGIDVLVLPSLYGEGLPMVVLEAMAAGIPIVATDVEGVPAAIRHGHEGVLIPPGDAPALARGIACIIEGELDWMTLRRNAVLRQRSHFSDHRMAAGVAAVYREVLAAWRAADGAIRPATGNHP
jgi:glycosyltransferase involved in cell wall biosynthesis